MVGIWLTITPCLAAVKQAREGNLRLFWATLPIIGLLLLGAAIIAWARRYREKPTVFHLTASEQLASFRKQFERGEISAEEFARIQTKLNERLKRELNVESAATPTAGPPLPVAGKPHASVDGTPPVNGTQEPAGPQSP